MNKIIIITGSTGGMGQVLCERLAARGTTLALCAKDSVALEKQAQSLQKSYNAHVFTKVVDICAEAEVAAFFQEAEAELGKVDALINLAGISIPASIDQMAEADYDTTMDVNLKGTFLACKHFAAHAATDGLIINIGSMAAHRANANAPVYCTAKAAVNMLSQGLAIQYAAKSIRVTTLNPGGVDTAFWGDRPVPREKLMQARDVVDMMLFVLDANPRVAIHSINFESFDMMR